LTEYLLILFFTTFRAEFNFDLAKNLDIHFTPKHRNLLNIAESN